MSTGVGTKKNYITGVAMFLNPFARRDNPFTLVVGMSGVKMGDRILQIGCGDAARLAAVASKVGLSGRAAAVVIDSEASARVEKAASKAGVLIEVLVAPPSELPVEDSAFDLAIIDDTAAQFTDLNAEQRGAVVRETVRVLRPGGRVMVIGSTPRGGLGAALSRTHAAHSADPTAALRSDGYRTVRLLAERDGLIFYEGMKARESKG
jgi:ubiquinone/menaquinone biosynthesis C-methylase UbiE